MSQFAVKWIFILDKDFVFNVRQYLTGNFSEGCAFVDRQGKRRLEIHPNGDAKVLAGYSWDGCTPKFAIWDIVFGIPEGVSGSLCAYVEVKILEVVLACTAYAGKTLWHGVMSFL